jgi:hypothetical protein
MILKSILLILSLIFNASILFAQNDANALDSVPSNNIYINLLGDASWISVNYERRFFVRPTYFLTSKIGYGYNEEFQICIWDNICSSNHQYITVPHHISVNVGNGRSFLEVGIGGTIIIGHTDQPYLLYPIFGYRLHPLKKNKINFRFFGEVPFSGLITEDIIFFPFGLSLGVSL